MVQDYSNTEHHGENVNEFGGDLLWSAGNVISARVGVERESGRNRGFG